MTGEPEAAAGWLLSRGPRSLRHPPGGGNASHDLTAQTGVPPCPAFTATAWLVWEPGPLSPAGACPSTVRLRVYWTRYLGVCGFKWPVRPAASGSSPSCSFPCRRACAWFLQRIFRRWGSGSQHGAPVCGHRVASGRLTFPNTDVAGFTYLLPYVVVHGSPWDSCQEAQSGRGYRHPDGELPPCPRRLHGPGHTHVPPPPPGSAGHCPSRVLGRCDERPLGAALVSSVHFYTRMFAFSSGRVGAPRVLCTGCRLPNAGLSPWSRPRLRGRAWPCNTLY